MPLTTTQRRAYLDALGLSQRGFAEMIQWNDATVRSWCRHEDKDVPPEIDAWLQRRGEAAMIYNAAMDADPAPIVEHRPGPKPGSATGR